MERRKQRFRYPFLIIILGVLSLSGFRPTYSSGIEVKPNFTLPRKGNTTFY